MWKIKYVFAQPLEILQGVASSKQFNLLQDKLNSLLQLQSNPYDASIGAADLFHTLRTKGVTICQSNDNLIAWYAIEFDVPLWQRDRDFALMAKHLPLQLYE